MKKNFLVIYIFLLAMSLGAVGSSTSVSIRLTTSVPGYLIHGFLTAPSEAIFEESPTVNDAFNPNGAVLNYGIKTNTPIPLIVNATISDFEQQDVVNPAMIPVSEVKVGSTPAIYNSGDGNFHLLNFTPTPGTIFYAYTLTILVDQALVSSSPSGNYKSTVSIAIETDQ